MSIRTEKIVLGQVSEKANATIFKQNVMVGEVGGVGIELFSIKGPYKMQETGQANFYHVLLSLKGQARCYVGKDSEEIYAYFIVRIPYNTAYRIHVQKGREFHFLRISKKLDDKDKLAILREQKKHSFLYAKPFAECPTYSEDIKSEKSINRLILPEGLVPRFCMGSVETLGPDTVSEHEHPMLDQLFLGLKGCRCTVHADEKKALLTENVLLHIPLGSKHSVSVKKGDKLNYLWLDFFLSLEGQEYMRKQHTMDDK